MAHFKPALIIVDYQYDFCPPDGALAVPDALSILPHLNTLLSLPFALKIATRDAHPAGHISFASSHGPPDAIPSEATALVSNPRNPAEKQSIRLWPDHCIVGTRGAELVAGLRTDLLDGVVDKATDVGVEMLSAFASAFRDPPTGQTGLADRLREEAVTDVYVCGLATDYCVKSTALGAAAEGFRTFVVRDAVRGIDRSDEGQERVRQECLAQKIDFVHLDGPEVRRVREWV